ncbi:MAG: class I SAM-dependent RNA methyltransferase [Pseudohaliea sp.]
MPRKAPPQRRGKPRGPTQARRRLSRQAPAIGDEFPGTVRDVAATGEGIVEHPGGQVCFVPGAWLGERGRFRITGRRGRAATGALVALEAPSPDRVSPPCPHHGHDDARCGGCPWQFMAYDAQLAAKEARLRQALERLGVAEAQAPIWAAPETLGYRNRARLRSDGERIGFLAAGSNRLAPIDDCPVLTARNRETLAALRAQLPEPAWRPRRRGPLTVLPIDDEQGPEAVTPNAPQAFRQGNSAQNTRMREWLAGSITDLAGRPAVELFAGSGNFTDVLAAGGCRPVLALDSAGDAIATLQTRGLPAVNTLALDLFTETAPVALETALASAELLVMDPPREGLRQLPAFIRRAPRLSAIRYISCDVATFARDLEALFDAGFHLDEVQPLDLFPHTPHLELLATLSRPA